MDIKFLRASLFILVLLTTAGALQASAVVSVLQKDDAVLSLHGDRSRVAYVEYLHKPSFLSFLSFSVNEALGQWTTPELVVGGLYQLA